MAENFNVDELIKELASNPEAINNLTEEQTLELEKKLNPYGSTIFGDEKYTTLSFTNLREKYMTKLLTTGLVGFTYQMANEYVILDDDLSDKWKVDPEDYREVVEHPDKNNEEIKNNLYNKHYLNAVYNYKKENGIDLETEWEASEELKKQFDKESKEYVEDFVKDKIQINQNKFAQQLDINVREQSEFERKIIKRFLDRLFKFDPMIHAVNSFSEDSKVKDPERSPLVSDGSPIYNQVPNDTYNRFQMFYDVNYEKLREAVMYLYSEKPDMEVAINVFDSFDTPEEASDYVEKNKSKVITNLYTLTNNKWNLMGSFKQNRERMNFYNKNTVILENIFKQQEEDAKTGKELLSKRVRKMKMKNVKRYGKDHPNFLKYKKQNLDGIYDTTITKITEEDDEIVVEREVEVSDTNAKVDEDGVPEDSLEIKVTSVNAKTGDVKQSAIYTKAVPPEAN